MQVKCKMSQVVSVKLLDGCFLKETGTNSQAMADKSQPQSTINDVQLDCRAEEITKCPSAKIIKLLLKEMQKWKNSAHSDNETKPNLPQIQHNTDSETIQSDLTQESGTNFDEKQIVQSLYSILEERDYTVTKLIDDLHHLKYDHHIDGDDVSYDAAYEFFKDSATENQCDIDGCCFVERHYRDRGGQDNGQKMEDQDDLLMDIMSMIHSYFIHSFDTQRLTKNERQSIMNMAGSTSWKIVNDTICSDDIIDDTNRDEDDEKQSVNLLLMNKVTEILATKKRRGRRRFLDNDDDENVADEVVLDFAAMASAIGVEEKALSDGLSEYKSDRNKLIGDLIDVVYGDDIGKLPIWSLLQMDDDAKGTLFRKALYGYFHCFQLNTDNFTKLCRYIVERKRLHIDPEQMEKMLDSNNIDGRMFDKGDAEYYQNNGSFAKRFREIPDCKEQHVRQLYTAVKKWKFVEVKKVAVESKDEEIEDIVDGNNDTPPPNPTVTKQPNVYTIGKRFVFWKSQQQMDEYVPAKFGNIKEEILHSTLVPRCFPRVRAWNKLIAAVKVLVATKAALKTRSNGKFRWLYLIKKGEHFDDDHLCALKLYTDFTKLCSSFNMILRRGDPEDIAQFAHWTRILIETVQCYGSPLNAESAKKTYYRGVKKTFMFLTIVSRFNLPQSTSASV